MQHWAVGAAVVMPNISSLVSEARLNKDFLNGSGDMPARVAPVYSRTKFVFAQLGANASDLVEATLTDVQTNYRDIDYVYLDTSTAKMPYLVASAVELMGSERIVFGSDFPYADFRISRYCVDLAEIAEEEKAGRSRLP
jgi:predicted TIM-barrel fold metal-dependent hydrolase